ncbi:MAG TPA: hypothetical protein DD990_06070, partial [Cyanobacteria bacterium UBA11368]|nr:hypothetical protein [Cyanobacteria bacterium UBA11368]
GAPQQKSFDNCDKTDARRAPTQQRLLFFRLVAQSKAPSTKSAYPFYSLSSCSWRTWRLREREAELSVYGGSFKKRLPLWLFFD